MKNLKNILQKTLSAALVIFTLTSASLAFGQEDDTKEYPMKKNAAGQWEMLKEWPEKNPDFEVSQTYEFYNPKTGKTSKRIRTFGFYGATTQEEKEIKEAHEALEAIVDKYEADLPKIWDATKVISNETRDLIFDFIGKGFATMREANAVTALPDEAKAWFVDRLLANQGQLFMYVLRQHGKDNIDSSLAYKIAALTNELAKLKDQQGTFSQKLVKRVGIYGKLFGIRARVAVREVALNAKQKFELKKDQNGKKTWGPVEDLKREKLTRDVLQLFTEYIKNDYNKLDWRTETSKVQFNSFKDILATASIVRTEREFGQQTLIWTLAAATVYLTIQPPIEYTLMPTRDAAMLSGLINLLPTSLYTAHTYLTSGVRVLGDLNESLDIIMNPQKYGKPGVEEQRLEDQKGRDDKSEKASAIMCHKAVGM